MKTQEILDALKNFPGSHRKVCWRRNAKTRVNSPLVEKQSICYVRAGIDYAKLGSVIRGIENGERGEVQSLPWGEWIVFPYVIGHKGQEYIRLYPASFENLPMSVKWYVNGVEREKESLTDYLLSSELRDNENLECFTVKVESIRYID